jgi:hypothetical protein
MQRQEEIDACDNRHRALKEEEPMANTKSPNSQQVQYVQLHKSIIDVPSIDSASVLVRFGVRTCTYALKITSRRPNSIVPHCGLFDLLRVIPCSKSD